MLGGAVVLLGLVVGLWRTVPREAHGGPTPSRTEALRANPRVPSPPASGPTPTTATAPTPTPSAAAPEALEPELDALRTALRERYGARLGEPSVQVRMLEELMRYFQARGQDRWREELLAFLKVAFPELYDELAATLRNRLDYEKWVKDNDAYLKGLGDKERRAAMWDARNRLFGKEAAERIWAAELKNQAVADALTTIDAREGATVTEKLSAYTQRLQEVYGEQAPAHLARHQQELMNRFLDLSSIQRDLGAMTPDARARNLRAIRKELGLDEEALQRWDALDQTRDARWDAGARYMAEREALAKELSGDALEARLQEARARYFGAEADSIAQEEASGFYRFQRPRQWGRN